MANGAPALKAAATGADERLLIEAAQRDPSRFADLYEAHFERVYAFVARRVGDRDTAQDLTSDVFHQALANLGRFEWRGVPFAAWLFRIAANAIVDRAQQTAKERTIRHLGEADRTDLGSAELGDVSLDVIEQRARLFRLVNDLPDDQRRVIVMRFAEERSIREIAAALGRTEGAVKQLQFRGLQNLKVRMGVANG